MFQDNHFFGHAHILARYCGMDDARPPRIRGYLQHGWNTYCGAIPHYELLPGAWRFVWGEAPRRRARSLGRRAYVVGAPFNYLASMEPAVPQPREGTLFFLFHGWEHGRLVGDHQRLIAEIKETEPGPVTVSLFHTDYDRPELRGTYEDAGFRVVCFGERGGWNHDKPNRDFLPTLLAELRRHRRIVSNRLCTAVLYGISVGCEAAVYGDPMAVADEWPVMGGPERTERLWPELFGKDIDQAAAREITDYELGVRQLASPEELRHVFDWPMESA
jgi:hypothetical protein